MKKFDVIVGNPPYQQKQKNKGKKGGGATLWQKFVRLSINKLVKVGGYVALINPAMWRKPTTLQSPNNGLWELFTKQNNLHYLKIHSIKDGQKIFGMGTRFDWYILEKTENENDSN